jgi:hypothetical protein
VTRLAKALSSGAPRGTQDLGGAWDQDVASAVSEMRATGTADVPPLDANQAWALLSWCEGAASLLRTSGDAQRLSDALFALALLAPALDTRELLSVARLLRHASRAVGLDYVSVLSRVRLLGRDDLLAALQRVPETLPPTHRVGGKEPGAYERTQDVDVEALRRNLGLV